MTIINVSPEVKYKMPYPMINQLDRAKPALELTLNIILQYAGERPICIVGRGTSGVAIYTWLATKSDIPMDYIHIRKSEEKSHGSSIQVPKGWSAYKHYAVFLVDDNIDSGHTMETILHALAGKIERIEAIIANIPLYTTNGRAMTTIKHAVRDSGVQLNYLLYY